MIPLRVLVAILIASAALSCAGKPADDAGTDIGEAPELETARQAAQAVGQELMRRLVAEMEAGGPAQAMRVCSDVAQDLAAAHSRDGVTVRRVSLKVRNPADAPDPFERDALLRLEQLHRQGRLPDELSEVVEDDAGSALRYLRPIRVMPMCLRCHGPAGGLDPDVAQAIAERYPDDEATGYASDDLRGAISVSVRLGADPATRAH